MTGFLGCPCCGGSGEVIETEGCEPTTYYAIRCGAFVKLGRTKGQPERRLADLQTGSPYEMAVEAHIALRLPPEDVCEFERIMHTYCAGERQRGEWFWLGPRTREVVDYMATQRDLMRRKRAKERA